MGRDGDQGNHLAAWLRSEALDRRRRDAQRRADAARNPEGCRMAREPQPFNRPVPGTQPPLLAPEYGSTAKRAPLRPPIRLDHTLSELTGPGFAGGWAGPECADLTTQHSGAPLGERMILEGRILDEDGRPVPGTLVELWQCNAAGRYRHAVDQHDAPLDPNFTGAGQVVSGADGAYRFVTIKPGAYPWRNAPNAWRPAHIHFGVFGSGFAARLMTQMYFPGDPLLAYDAIFQSTPEPAARERLIARYDPATGTAEWALGYRFDIVLRGRLATPMEAA
jgi:protocatechuate 3,4-dioxygenase, beta subunit